MIQIDDWMVITGLIAIFLASIVYLAYFIITKKLFPKVVEFQKIINPNEGITISSIEGSGIIKKIEMKSTQNDKTSIIMIVDKISFITFSSSKKTISQGGNLNALEEILNVEINLEKKFERNFSIFFQNNSDKLSHSNGKIYYEIRKPFKITLRTILSELH
jgi:hypothetical protein